MPAVRTVVSDMGGSVPLALAAASAAYTLRLMPGHLACIGGASRAGWSGWSGAYLPHYLFFSPSAPSAARRVPSSLGAWVPTTIDLE